MTVSVRLDQFSDAVLGDGGIQYSQPRKAREKLERLLSRVPPREGRGSDNMSQCLHASSRRPRARPHTTQGPYDHSGCPGQRERSSCALSRMGFQGNWQNGTPSRLLLIPAELMSTCPPSPFPLPLVGGEEKEKEADPGRTFIMQVSIA